MLLINDEPEVTPKKSLAEETAYVVSMPFANLTFTEAACGIKSRSVTNILAPTAVTPGLKVTFRESASSRVLTTILPAAISPIYKPCGEENAYDDVPEPKLPFKLIMLPTVNALKFIVDDIVSFAFAIAVVKPDNVL